MTRIISVLVIGCISITEVSSQSTIPKPAEELSRFETSWLQANLNNDQSWLNRFSSRKLSVSSAEIKIVKDRFEAVMMLIQTPLSPDEMKVRISGTVSLLTNDPNQNRSYYFLDTFNKIGGKWQIIASGIAPAQTVRSSGREQIEPELIRLENEWSRAETARNFSLLDKIADPDIFITSPEGKVRNRDEWTGWNNVNV